MKSKFEQALRYFQLLLGAIAVFVTLLTLFTQFKERENSKKIRVSQLDDYYATQKKNENLVKMIK